MREGRGALKVPQRDSLKAEMSNYSPSTAYSKSMNSLPLDKLAIEIGYTATIVEVIHS